MAIGNCLASNILQNIFFVSNREKRNSYTVGLEQLEGK